MAEITPFFQGHSPITCVASGAITGGRFVAVAADLSGDDAGAIAGGGGYPTVAHADTPGAVIGVAARDAADGETVQVYPPNWVVPLEIAGAVSAGDQLVTDAAGKAVVRAAAADGEPAGEGANALAFADGAADGDFVMARILG